ncbi:MAG: glycoside hydrolase family 5 protein [Treponema sp.]|nr:glycoside hydrolase family 5 protein [Treponema sp.]
MPFPGAKSTDLWKTIADRYKDSGDHVRYELLNEVDSKMSEEWNNYVQTPVPVRQIRRRLSYGAP